MNAYHPDPAPSFGGIQGIFVAFVLVFCAAGVPKNCVADDLEFALDASAGIEGLSAESAITAAMSSWSSTFHDPVTISLSIEFDSETTDFPSLPASVLGATINSFEAHTYSDVKMAMSGDVTSAADLDSMSLLQDGTYLEAMTNVSGTTTPVRIGSSIGSGGESTWNSVLKVTRANSKALGLSVTDDGAPDIRIVINDDFVPLFDFDRSDGITAGMLDFQTIIAHEIGHGMGFISGVDSVDFEGPMGGGSGEDLSDEAIFGPLDLFRTNIDTRAMTGLPGDGGGFVLDWRYGPEPGPSSLPFFSLDGELIDPLDKTPFSTGAFHGDGEQASHWSDMFPIGLMTPDLDAGITLDLSPTDIAAFDVIGWDTISAVPEPSSLIVISFACLCALTRRKKWLAIQ